MQPKISSVRMSIVDVLGMMLPGSVWIVILMAAAGWLGWKGLPADGSVAGIGSHLASTCNSTGEYAAFVGGALMVGILVNAVASRPAEFLACAIPAVWKIQSARFRGVPQQYRFSDYFFPYRAYHVQRPYYAKICSLVKEATDSIPDELPRHQPLSSCRRLLRLYAPALWEEAQYLEAQARMVASLVLAAYAWFFLSLIALSHTGWHNVVASALSVAFLTLAYRRRHFRETDYAYLNTMVAYRTILAQIRTETKDAECNPREEG